MRMLILTFVCMLFFGICWGQKPKTNNDQESIKRTIINFLKWYKKQEEPHAVVAVDTTKWYDSVIIWEEIDTLIKPTVNMVAVEDYLNILKASHYLSETFINNLRQYHQKIKNDLNVVIPSPKIEGMYAIPGLNLDVVFGSFEPEAIYDRYKTGVFERISIVNKKAIVQFYIPSSSNSTYIKMLFTLTKEKSNWLIDYIGYYQ